MLWRDVGVGKPFPARKSTQTVIYKYNIWTMTNGYIQMMRWQQENTIHHKLEIVSRVRLTVNNVPTHRTHTQVTTKVTKLQSHTQSVSKTVDSTSTQVEGLMAHARQLVAGRRPVRRGNDTQPENCQPAGGTRHQRPHVRHDHGSNDDGERERRNTYSNSSLVSSKELFGTRTRLAPGHPSC